MYFLVTDLGASILESMKIFTYSICTYIYQLITFLYNIFDMLCHSRILGNDLLEQISSRVGLILGLIMLFRVLFSFVQILINPDTINDKEKGAFNIVKRILIVIVLLGVTPYLFDFAFTIQNKLLGANSDNANVISRLLLPETVDTDNFGGVLSSNIFLSFYTMNDALNGLSISSEDMSKYELCENYRKYLQRGIVEDNSFDFGYNCLDKDKVVAVSAADSLSGEEEKYSIIDFNWLLAIIVGLFICWTLLVYCFSVGIRVIQLAFLQIVSPMPIIAYLSPKKDGMFQKWVKMCVTTYLDVFIRVAIINFIVLIIAYLINGFDAASSTFWESIIVYKSISGKTKIFLMVVMILALLQFAKKAPELLKELLPKSWAASGDFGFGLKNRSVLGGAIGKGLAVAGGVATGGAIGLVSGIAGGNSWKNRISGAVGGVLGGATRGLSNGIKTKDVKPGSVMKSIGTARKNQAAAGLKRAQRIASGATLEERIGDAAKGYFGVQASYASADAQVSAGQAVASALDGNSNYKRIKQRYDQANENLMTARLNAETEYKKSVAEITSNFNKQRDDISTQVGLGSLTSTEAAHQIHRLEVEENRQLDLALTTRNDTVEAVETQFKKAKAAKGAMEAALYGLASGNIGDGTEFKEKFDAGLITFNSDDGKYYVDGLDVKSYEGLGMEIKNFERISGSSPTGYSDFDDLNTSLVNARRNVHKGGK